MNKTVLVIDHGEALVEVESFYFSGQGYTVYTAFDGDLGVMLAQCSHSAGDRPIIASRQRLRVPPG